jgi:hypothetical protein
MLELVGVVEDDTTETPCILRGMGGKTSILSLVLSLAPELELGLSLSLSLIVAVVATFVFVVLLARGVIKKEG